MTTPTAATATTTNEALYTGLSPVWRSIVDSPTAFKPPADLWSGTGPVAVFPPPADVFNALRLCPDPAKVRVVILGQDPYPTRGNAHGLAFSVRTGVAIPASLKNIYKELETDLGTSKFTSGNLTPWSVQGVLLLNDILTVEEGKPMSHKHLKWSELTDTILATVLRESPHVVIVAWGAKAQDKLRTEDIHDLILERKHTVLKAPHPSPLSAHSGFFGSRPFTKINDDLVKHGLEPICWSL
jgi:uracil-DNA glycosylase